MQGHPLNEADGFVLTMICVMLFSFGTVVILIYTIWRNASRRNLEVEDLLDEVSREQPKLPAATVEKSVPVWEKEADWWKK